MVADPRPLRLTQEAFLTVKEAVQGFSRDKVSRMGAALAFYTIFSVAPLIMVAVAVAGAVFGERAASGEVFEQLRQFVGEPAARTVSRVVQEAQARRGAATAFASVLVFLGSSAVFLQLQDALNTIWGVRPKHGWLRTVVVRRLQSFTVVLGVGVLLLAMILSGTVLATVEHQWGHLLPAGLAPWRTMEDAVSFGLLTLAFFALFEFLPDVDVRKREVFAGALASAVLFTFGRYLLGLYLRHAAAKASVYGAAGSFVVFLVWVYYSSQILLFGAELTKAMTARAGLRRRAREAAELSEL